MSAVCHFRVMAVGASERNRNFKTPMPLLLMSVLWPQEYVSSHSDLKSSDLIVSRFKLFMTTKIYISNDCLLTFHSIRLWPVVVKQSI